MKKPQISARLWRVCLAALVVGVTLASSQPAASAATARTVRGTVICTSGRSVAGVYLKSSGGGSRFAEKFSRIPNIPNAAYFESIITTNSASTRISLHVGCGGNSATWTSNNRTPEATVTSNRTLNTRCSDSGTVTQQSCKWPPKGDLAGSNLGDEGWCTWGAYYQWRQRTGTYPYIGGNAKDFAQNATTHHWQVSRAPHIRAIVMFPPGVGTQSELGHVGYVTKMRVTGGRALITFVEMNGAAGFGKWSTREIAHQAGMQYIVSTL